MEITKECPRLGTLGMRIRIISGGAVREHVGVPAHARAVIALMYLRPQALKFPSLRLSRHVAMHLAAADPRSCRKQLDVTFSVAMTIGEEAICGRDGGNCVALMEKRKERERKAGLCYYRLSVGITGCVTGVRFTVDVTVPVPRPTLMSSLVLP
ncbi:hypothetical protein J6590_023062 [Homalodisca vitripennis]|nr:hypothetical protein J6590_023062 [Homalodisca vitripennis]